MSSSVHRTPPKRDDVLVVPLRREEISRYKGDLIGAWALAVPTFLTMFLSMTVPPVDHALSVEIARVPVGSWIRLLLSTPVQASACFLPPQSGPNPTAPVYAYLPSLDARSPRSYSLPTLISTHQNRVIRTRTHPVTASPATIHPQWYFGRTFHRGALRAARHCSADMNVLVSLGTSAAWGYSVLAMLLRMTELSPTASDFFETSALLIAFILMGKYLEAIAKGRTSQAMQALLAMAPPTAVLLRPRREARDAAGACARNADADASSEGTWGGASCSGGSEGAGGGRVGGQACDGERSRDWEEWEEEEVPVGLLQPGDVVRVAPGGRVPVDGVVVGGASEVDESMVTGEWMPVPKRQGDAVIGGSMNAQGSIDVRATRVG